MLARVATDRLGGAVERLNSNVLLSIGDTFGEASRSYTLQELSQTYSVLIDGTDRRVLPMSRPVATVFPAPLGVRSSYLFPFSDQVFFPATLGARTALTRLALDPPWLSPALSALVRLHVISILARRRRSGGPAQRVINWLQSRNAGHDWYGLVVEADGRAGSVRASVAGRGQADITAFGAAAIARAIIDGQVSKPGIWLTEEVVPPESFFEHLATKNVVPKFEQAFRSPAPLDQFGGIGQVRAGGRERMRAPRKGSALVTAEAADRCRATERLASTLCRAGLRPSPPTAGCLRSRWSKQRGSGRCTRTPLIRPSCGAN
jgi:hypothetical protein